MRRLAVIFVTLLAMVGCRLAPMAPQTPLAGASRTAGSIAMPVAPSILAGRVVWPETPKRAVQATIGEVGRASTVSLINVNTGEIVDTALTTLDGRFQLTGVTPTAGVFTTWRP